MTKIQIPDLRQHDAMDCGPTCLRMITSYYGRRFPASLVREKCAIGREGVSLLGINHAAEQLGLRGLAVKIPYLPPDADKPGLVDAPMPCIVHWNQNHFVVLYRITSRKVWVADPAKGKFQLSKNDFEKHWSNGAKGVALLLEPSPVFYEEDQVPELKEKGLRMLLPYLKPFKAMFGALAMSLGLLLCFQIITPLLSQSVVDIGIWQQQLGFIKIMLIAQLTIFLSQSLVNIFQGRVLLQIGANLNIALLKDFLAKIVRLPIGFFDTRMTGDLLQRIGDHKRIETFLTSNSITLIFSFFQFLVFGGILLYYHAHVFLVFLSFSLLYIAWVVYFLKRRKQLDYLRFQYQSDNQNNLIELIQGMQEIKMQGSERKRRWQWIQVQAKLFRVSMKSLYLSQWQDTGALLINQLKDILIAYYAAKAVLANEMSLGMMLSVQYIVGQLNAPLFQVIGFLRTAQDARISLERLQEVYGHADEGAHVASAGPSSRLYDREEGATLHRGDIAVQDLTFRYTPLSDDVLKNINCIIPEGKITAIVGSSGSGKTTLLKLLLGFYQPVAGDIKVGGMPLRFVSPAAWRSRCGAVLQDGFIFSDTIGNNIAESSEGIQVERLVHAAHLANIQSFVTQMPNGYDTLVGSRGSGISQGQKQRLLIARAIYKDPEYLFFDEATNALDTENEKIIMENLYRYFKGKTVVIIAHRLSTVVNADQIIVLEKGRILETGNHHQLVSNKGRYYELIKNQLELGN